MSDSTDERSSSPSFDLYAGDVLDVYPRWPTPAIIISDGAYGVRGFHGDTVGPGSLAEWYRPHVAAWSTAAAPSTTLWFWNTEVGWATVHPLLQDNGWDYVELITWDKGIAHIAGNVNGKTIRRFPVVTEVCVLYQRRFEITTGEGSMSVQRWLRHEWRRAGIPLSKANEACGVRNAATRKYLTQDWLWYWPPGEMMEKLATYANEHGRPADWPYFSIDGQQVVTAKQWDSYRYLWNHRHGITNVWRRGPLHNDERLKGTLRRAAPRVYKPSSASAAHLNQKPLEFMETIVKAASTEGDVVWEPFGGLASASVAAVALGRRAYAAETDPEFVKLAKTRLLDAVAAADPAAESQQEQLLTYGASAPLIGCPLVPKPYAWFRAGICAAGAKRADVGPRRSKDGAPGPFADGPLGAPVILRVQQLHLGCQRHRSLQPQLAARSLNRESGPQSAQC